MKVLEIDCIWCPSRKDFNKFMKHTIKKSTKTIDFLSIISKLIKSDPYLDNPSDSIIGLTIINEITRSLAPNVKEIDRVIYLFRSLDSQIVSNLKDLISSITEREFIISLIIIGDEIKIDESVRFQFDYIKYISND